MKKILLILTMFMSSNIYSQNLADSLELLTYGYKKSEIYTTGVNKIFNIELGQPIQNINGKKEINNKLIIDIDFKGFKKAMISYTPTTEKVTTITTMKKTDSDCIDEAEIISKIFGERYGNFNKKDSFYYIQENDTTLIIQCDIYKNLTIMLNNAALNDLYKDEIIKISIEKEQNNF